MSLVPTPAAAAVTVFITVFFVAECATFDEFLLDQLQQRHFRCAGQPSSEYECPSKFCFDAFDLKTEVIEVGCVSSAVICNSSGCHYDEANHKFICCCAHTFCNRKSSRLVKARWRMFARDNYRPQIAGESVAQRRRSLSKFNVATKASDSHVTSLAPDASHLAVTTGTTPAITTTTTNNFFQNTTHTMTMNTVKGTPTSISVRLPKESTEPQNTSMISEPSPTDSIIASTSPSKTVRKLVTKAPMANGHATSATNTTRQATQHSVASGVRVPTIGNARRTSIKRAPITTLVPTTTIATVRSVSLTIISDLQQATRSADFRGELPEYVPKTPPITRATDVLKPAQLYSTTTTIKLDHKTNSTESEVIVRKIANNFAANNAAIQRNPLSRVSNKDLYDSNVSNQVLNSINSSTKNSAFNPTNPASNTINQPFTTSLKPQTSTTTSQSQSIVQRVHSAPKTSEAIVKHVERTTRSPLGAENDGLSRRHAYYHNFPWYYVVIFGFIVSVAVFALFYVLLRHFYPSVRDFALWRGGDPRESLQYIKGAKDHADSVSLNENGYAAYRNGGEEALSALGLAGVEPTAAMLLDDSLKEKKRVADDSDASSSAQKRASLFSFPFRRFRNTANNMQNQARNTNSDFSRFSGSTVLLKSSTANGNTNDSLASHCTTTTMATTADDTSLIIITSKSGKEKKNRLTKGKSEQRAEDRELTVIDPLLNKHYNGVIHISATK